MEDTTHEGPAPCAQPADPSAQLPTQVLSPLAELRTWTFSISFFTSALAFSIMSLMISMVRCGERGGGIGERGGRLLDGQQARRGTGRATFIPWSGALHTTCTPAAYHLVGNEVADADGEAVLQKPLVHCELDLRGGLAVGREGWKQ